MLSLFGAPYSLKNVYLLASKYVANQRLTDTRDLRRYYLEFLARHQPHQPIPHAQTLLVCDPDIEVKLKDAYGTSQLNDLNQQAMIGEAMTPEEKAPLASLIEDGLGYMSQASPELKSVFDLVIHSILLRRSSKTSAGGLSFGGSSSTAMGTIWISGHGKLTKFDIAELMVHELTHHLLFIAERCKAQFFYSEMILPENYARSAILNKQRPLDKVVHSIVVSTEVLLARAHFLGEHDVIIHPDSATMRQNSLHSIDEVLALPRLNKVVTPWTIALLERCRAALIIREAKAC